MTTHSVVLTQHEHDLVESLVESGRYQNASEVLCEGLRLLERQEAEGSAGIAALRAAADKGWADLATGRYVDIDGEDLDEVISQLGDHSATHGRSAG